MRVKQMCLTILMLVALVAVLPSVAPAKKHGKAGKSHPGASAALDKKLDRELRMKGVEDADYLSGSAAQIELGNLLFYDKVLSGNEDISCATCHHALMATGDGLSLSTGVGGHGLATARAMGAGRERVPRNAPEVFNRGHKFFTSMFWDSRVAENPDDPTGFTNPAESDLPPGFRHALEVQAMFPLTSDAEMRGNPGENEIANAGSNPEIWERVEDRVMAIPEYRSLMAAAYPDVAEEDIGCEHVARAIAAFEADAWRSDDSPFDRYLRGDRDAMSESAKRGALLFYGKAGCSDCHSGVFQTDLEHYAIAMPQLGPGKGQGADGDEDLGRGPISGDPADDFKFRTPPLRNVALSGPYGHDGAYRTLEDVVRHHLDPVEALMAWDRSQVLLSVSDDPEDVFSVMDDPAKVAAIAAANELKKKKLSEKELDALMAFMHALTDPAMLDLRGEVPLRVTSGLPLAD